MPRSVYGTPSGEEEKAKLAKLREEEAREVAEPAVPDAEAESRKRELDELEQRKKALEEESAKKQREIEEEEKRIRAVEEAERRAKEPRAKQALKDRKGELVREESRGTGRKLRTELCRTS